MSSPPTKYGITLFKGFQALDVFGPLDVLNVVSVTHPLSLSLIAPTLDPVSTQFETSKASIGQSIVPTHTYENAPDDIEVLIVPGGIGARMAMNSQAATDFVRERFPKLRYLLTVCTGSVVVARGGILEGKEATSNKLRFQWVTSHGRTVKWIKEARWVTDGNIWTSSGITAGIDMTLAYVGHLYGENYADEIATMLEHVRNRDSRHDPFANLE